MQKMTSTVRWNWNCEAVRAEQEMNEWGMGNGVETQGG